jgi:hypothetical protein
MNNTGSRINSDNYRDYVIKDGKFIGAFEEMYQNIEDPWNHGNATAIQYAKKTYCNRGIEFSLVDIQEEYQEIRSQYDLIVISQLVWYILPKIREIMEYLVDNVLAENGYLIINQAFYKPDEQTYGKEIISTIEDLIRYLKIPPVEILESNRLTNHDAVLLFQKMHRTE